MIRQSASQSFRFAPCALIFDLRMSLSQNRRALLRDLLCGFWQGKTGIG
jgi:hypothetical protein